MKHLFILFLFIGVSQFGFSQSACDNFEKAKQIDASADQKDHGTLKQIVLYWSKRCACESGSITGGTWDYTVEVANRVYDNYKDGGVTMGYTGPSFPVPDKRITVNDCNSDNNFNINPDISDCKPNTFSNSEDPQQYGNAFMLARCECEKGVPNEERAKQLEATMKINFQNAKTYYGNTLGMPQPMKWTECPIIQFGGIQSNENTQKSTPSLIYTGRESDLDKLKDQYLETFSTNESFSAYVSGENIKRLGVSMAKDFADNLKSIGKLIETTDPAALQKDYLEKMQNIENLEAEFNAESNSYFFQSGQNLGSSISNQDYESAMFQAGGLLNAHLERKEAEKELARQKAELEAAKAKQMRALYNKAKDFNNQKRKEFLLLAANCEDLEKEKYYLGMVENIDCYQETMWQGYLYDKPNWIVNKCAMPKLESSSEVENKFISEDVLLSKVAKRKYEVFLETGYNDFRNAAIAYASSACSKKPSAKYFDQIAHYYQSYSAVLELTNYLAANELDPGFYNKNDKRAIDSLKMLVEQEINYAFEFNKNDYIQSFLSAGLDNVVFIKNKSIYHYAISIDEPLALQTILNNRLENKSESEKQELLKRTVMLCAANNAGRCLNKFAQLGVSLDFNYKNEHPIEVAEKTLSEDAYMSILNHSTKATYFKEKYKNSPIHILFASNDSPSKASMMLESIFESDDFSRVIDRMIEQLQLKEHYFVTLGNTKTALDYIHNNGVTKGKIYAQLRQSIFLPNYDNNSHLFFEHDLISLDRIPTLGDLGFIESVKIKSIDPVKTPKSEYYEGKQYVYLDPNYTHEIYDLNTDLGYISFVQHNPDLFHALDKKYDLNQSKRGTQSLFERILNSGSFLDLYSFHFISLALDYADFSSRANCSSYDHLYDPDDPDEITIRDNPHTMLELSEMQHENILQEIRQSCKVLNRSFSLSHYYYSSDFDFSKKINGEYPLFIYLDSALTKHNIISSGGVANNFVLYELYQILTRYNFDRNIQDKNGETILHWLVRHVRGYTNGNASFTFPELQYNIPEAAFINNLGIDKTIVNNKGETAYDLFKSLKREIPDNCMYCNTILNTFDGELDMKSGKFIFTNEPDLFEKMNRDKWLKEVLK